MRHPLPMAGQRLVEPLAPVTDEPWGGRCRPPVGGQGPHQRPPGCRLLVGGQGPREPRPRPIGSEAQGGQHHAVRVALPGARAPTALRWALTSGHGQWAPPPIDPYARRWGRTARRFARVRPLRKPPHQALTGGQRSDRATAQRHDGWPVAQTMPPTVTEKGWGSTWPPTACGARDRLPIPLAIAAAQCGDTQSGKTPVLRPSLPRRGPTAGRIRAVGRAGALRATPAHRAPQLCVSGLRTCPLDRRPGPGADLSIALGLGLAGQGTPGHHRPVVGKGAPVMQRRCLAHWGTLLARRVWLSSFSRMARLEAIARKHPYTTVGRTG